MKNFIKSLVLVLTMATGLSAWATKPIEILVPYATGGAADMNARALSKYLEKHGIENAVTYYPGADGDIGYNRALSMRDDVILIGAHANLVFSHVVQKRKNHHADTLYIIGPTLKAAQGFITGPNGFANYRDLVQQAKQQDLPCGTGNSAGTAELLRFNKMFGTRFVPVPYKGSGPLAQDLAGDHVRCAFDTLASHYTRHDGKLVKILSTSFAAKIDVPLMSTELAIDRSESWYAFTMPKDSNLVRNDKLIKLLKEFGNDRSVIQGLLDQGYLPAKIDSKINDDIRRQSDYYNSLMK
jgi:tripartite-type tricarboxylate transporter receptor subunit TctC